MEESRQADLELTVSGNMSTDSQEEDHCVDLGSERRKKIVIDRRHGPTVWEGDTRLLGWNLQKPWHGRCNIVMTGVDRNGKKKKRLSTQVDSATTDENKKKKIDVG